jgi:LuxR family transcriptional regulator, maltose regulon positive regulatory protein
VGQDSESRPLERDRSVPAFPLLTSKLARPFARPGVVERASLLARLSADVSSPVVSLVAPAGYGKTTFLHQWVEASAREAGWLTLDRDDDDPSVLLRYLAAALDRLTPLDPELFSLLAVEYPSHGAITRKLGAALAAWPQPNVLVIDDVHAVQNPACRDILATLVEHVPPGSQLVFASRHQLPLPVPRLRAQGRLLEVGPDDLAMDVTEAAALLEGAEVEMSDDQVQQLVRVAEGWPVAIYLVGRSVKARGTAAGLDIANVGHSRQIVEYARSELLAALPTPTVEFLTRSSVLHGMSGPFCDAVLRSVGSAERLEELARSSLLVTALDQDHSWYRYHHLVRQLLAEELIEREPDLVAELRRRAARWCEANGLPDEAIEYAIAADDVDHAARLVTQRAFHLYRAGRVETLLRWFDWFDRGGHMAHHPGLANTAALAAAVTGRAAAAERWAEAAERGAPGPRVARGRAEPGDRRAIIGAALCRQGLDEAFADAVAAERATAADDPLRATALTVLGLVHLARGEPEDADIAFLRAAEAGVDTRALPAASVALAGRAVLAADRGEMVEARTLAARASAVVDEGRLQDHAMTVLAHAEAARMAFHGQDIPATTALLARAQRLRPRLTYALPHLAVLARLELARTMVGLGDAAGARTVLREVNDIFRLRGSLGALSTRANELGRQLEGAPATTVGAFSLTTAEMRLLPLLETYLSFREIGERLFVSPNTVKTQAISIYRKLGVSSRSDAMRTARELGLLAS